MFVNCCFKATPSIRNLAWSYELAYIIKVLLLVSAVEIQSDVDMATPHISCFWRTAVPRILAAWPEIPYSAVVTSVYL